MIKLIRFPNGGLYFGEGFEDAKGSFIKDGRGIDIYINGSVSESW
jgi:hypothetical protein